VVLVAERLQGGPVNSGVGAFPGVLGIVEGGSKGAIELMKTDAWRVR